MPVSSESRGCARQKAPRISAALCAFLLSLPLSSDAQGDEIRYVNDVIFIDLRVAPDSAADTLRVIPSGTRMVVQESDREGDFVRVRLDSGEEGWVLERFLSSQPIARERLAAAQATIERLETENSRLQSELTQASAPRAELEAEVQALRQENQSLRTEFAELQAVSGEALMLNERLQQLDRELADERQLRQAAVDRVNQSRTRLIAIVAIAAVLGLLFGFYIGYSPTRRANQWRKVS